MDGVGLTVTCIGAILVYAGARGYSVLDVVRNVITGKPITENVDSVSIGKDPNVSASGVTTTDGGSSGETPVNTTANENQEIAKAMANAYGGGWDQGVQWSALYELWMRESSWNNHAKNPSSGAYGIPQALPFSKMPKDAWPEDAGGSSDTNAQVAWGFEYIAGRYGTPLVALTFHKKNGWY